LTVSIVAQNRDYYDILRKFLFSFKETLLEMQMDASITGRWTDPRERSKTETLPAIRLNLTGDSTIELTWQESVDRKTRPVSGLFE
jgi:hypothetical protein